MVMVFDQFGEQIGEYQGKYAEVRERILADAPFGVEYLSGDWREKGSAEKIDQF